MSNTRTLELDISKEGAGTCIKVGQGDDGGTTIKALIYDNGAEFTLTGATAWLVVLLPNKRNYYRGQCSVSGNAATITVDESKLCSVSGYTTVRFPSSSTAMKIIPLFADRLISSSSYSVTIASQLPIGSCSM